MVMSQTVN